MNFKNKIDAAIEKNNSLVCVGLDPDTNKMPEQFKSSEKPLFEFCKYIVDETHESVSAYKPNSAFFEAFGADGIQQLKDVCGYIRISYPDILIILDAKRGDIGNTNLGYVRFAFDYLGCDAITLSPYMGEKSLEPFLSRADKGCIILCHTSNEGAGEFQNLKTNGQELYKTVAQAVANEWNKNDNCLLVTGSTYPEELKEIRDITGSEMTFLVPGIGAQGGNLEATLKSGLNNEGKGLIINSSRGIIYSESPSQAAKELKNQINSFK